MGEKMQADGSGTDAKEQIEGGRTGGGESGGGAYKEKDLVKPDPDAGGVMGHGGQTDIGYYGTGGVNDPDKEHPKTSD